VTEPAAASNTQSASTTKATPATPAPLVVRGARKSFAGIDVLKGVNLDIQRGEIHALVGSNGSGKSTFVKLITGTYSADRGTEIEFHGQKYGTNLKPPIARAMGVRAVHQEAPLIDQLTVAEHFGLEQGFPVGPLGWVRRRALNRKAGEALERVGAQVDPKALASQLSASQRAQTSLALAMADIDAESGLLVLDEATALLPAPEAAPILRQVSGLAKEGIGVLIVTHRLGEVSEHAHRTTVLRDGEVVLETGPTTPHDELVNAMVGRTSDEAIDAHHDLAQRDIDRSGDAVLRVSGLSGAGFVENVSFEVHAGEILGIAGIGGSGTSEVARMLSGAEHRDAGEIEVDGKPAGKRWTARHAINAGVCFLPQDRHAEGGVLTLSLEQNVSLPRYDNYFMKTKAERSDVDGVIKDLEVQPPDRGKTFAEFSGGNQQKALLGKWLMLDPRVLVLDDPTYGVDPNARETLLHKVAELAEGGAAVVVISTEPEQLARVSDRVLVMRSGRLSGELTGDDINEVAISLACFS
jgi:ribose transport system ATP-binding protein